MNLAEPWKDLAALREIERGNDSIALQPLIHAELAVPVSPPPPHAARVSRAKTQLAEASERLIMRTILERLQGAKLAPPGRLSTSAG
jgi:hypothetical protein